MRPGNLYFANPNPAKTEIKSCPAAMHTAMPMLFQKRKRYLGEEIKIINGDKPILRVTENEVRIYGTPWAGKEQWQSNANVPLKGICLLQRGKENHIRQIRPVEALPQLMQQIYYTSDVGMAAKTMELLNQVFAQVPVYQMECNISEEAMRCSFNEMRKVCERK